VLFHGSKVIIKFARDEKGVRFMDGAGFSSSDLTWTDVFIAAKAVEKTYDAGD
jgi:cold shock CspA family protein